MKKILYLVAVFVWGISVSKFAAAQEKFLMTGAARFERSSEPHALPFPVNPVASGVLTLDGGVFTFHYAGDRCVVKAEKKMGFYFDPVLAHAFGSPDSFARFIAGKFHLSNMNLRETYLLGEASVPLCSGLRETMVYASSDAFLVVGGAWIYVFQRLTHEPADAESSFDCSKASTSVEHIICGSRDLIKFDEVVNRGFVAMQLLNSTEISYQDPVRMDQINWIRNIRNKCVNASCLFDAYRSRIRFIKGKISSAYPSYPDKEPDQEGD
jgi:uncharacterized protein YecT (DUF1311 family)